VGLELPFLTQPPNARIVDGNSFRLFALECTDWLSLLMYDDRSRKSSSIQLAYAGVSTLSIRDESSGIEEIRRLLMVKSEMARGKWRLSIQVDEPSPKGFITPQIPTMCPNYRGCINASIFVYFVRRGRAGLGWYLYRR
jgi:hypothetical protein